jgi:hypothetical protein
MASASTWSLERLDALAAEVKSEIMRDLNPEGLIALDEGRTEASPEDAVKCDEGAEGKTARWKVS